MLSDWSMLSDEEYGEDDSDSNNCNNNNDDGNDDGNDSNDNGIFIINCNKYIIYLL